MKTTVRSVVCVLLMLVMLAGMGSGVFAWMYDTYDDVQRGSWYYEAVMEMSNMGVMNGVRAHVFAPHQTLTRAMAVTILYRLNRRPDTTEIEQPFTDVVPIMKKRSGGHMLTELRTASARLILPRMIWSPASSLPA